jgi:hypothetical protein
MGYLLLWIEGLVVVLLLVALATACAADWSQRWVRRAVPLAAALVPGGLGAWATGFCLVELLGDGPFAVSWWFVYTLTWTIAFWLGALVLMRIGRSRVAPEAPPMARAWPRGVLLVALAAAVLVQRTTFANLDLALKLYLANLRTEGGTLALSVSPPRVEDSENAALVYEKAFALLTSPAEAQSPAKEKLQTWLELDPTRIDFKDEVLRDFLQQNEPGLKLCRQAAVMPHCWFERDYATAKTVAFSVPELDKMRSAASCLALDALAKAAANHPQAALEDVQAIYGIAYHVNDPYLASLLVSIAIEDTGKRALEHVLKLSTPTPDSIAKLSIDDPERAARQMLRALWMEEAVLYSTFGITFQSGKSAYDRPLLQSPWLPPGISDRAYLHLLFVRDELPKYRELMTQRRRLLARPFWEIREGLDELDGTLSGKQSIAALMTPALSKMTRAMLNAAACRQVTRTALAVWRYQQKHGRYPGKLDELVPEFLEHVPIDPCDGQPLFLKRDGEWLLIYSVGPNGEDEGGAPRDPKSGSNDDVVFRLRAK